MDEGRTEADPTADEDHVMRPDVPWPLHDDQFPDVLGAVVMKSVFEGRRPALQVVHFDDGHWGVADGIDDPRVRNLIAARHPGHLLERDPSIGELATLPPGRKADRDAIGEPWTISDQDDDFPNPRLRGRLWRAIDVFRLGDEEAQRRFESRFGPTRPPRP